MFGKRMALSDANQGQVSRYFPQRRQVSDDTAGEKSVIERVS